MIRVLVRDTEEDTDREKPREDGGKDWSDAAINPGMPGAPRSWRGREDPPLEPLEGASGDNMHLDF